MIDEISFYNWVIKSSLDIYSVKENNMIIFLNQDNYVFLIFSVKDNFITFEKCNYHFNINIDFNNKVISIN